VVKDEPRDGGLSRRRFLRIGLATGVGIAGASFLAPAAGLVPKVIEIPANAPPQPGDRLVFAQGSRQGQVIAGSDVPPAGPQILAWPMDPRNRTVRSGDAKNLVLLVRAPTDAWFSGTELHRTADGVAAYAATCTHLCCTVSDWGPGNLDGDRHGHLLCPCHHSKFNPWNGARVLSGPAPRPLPILPLAGHGGELEVAGGFVTQVGCGRV
jgi:rieske iron-sulfur protein